MNGDTRLYRQIHPEFINRGRVTSQAFHPSSGDPCNLSVYDGDQITAEKAWRHYTSKVQLKSAGVMAVIVDECKRMGLKCVLDRDPYPEHALISFGGFTKSRVKKASKSLRAAAESRGWVFQPDG